MAGKDKSKRVVKRTSLSGEGNENATNEKEIIPENQPTNQTTEQNAASDTSKAGQVPLDESPLLSSGRIERDYAMNGPEQIESNNDTLVTQDTEQANKQLKEQSEAVNNNSNVGDEPVYRISQEPPTDAPEQSYNQPTSQPTNDEGNENILDVPDKTAKAAANDFADFILDAWVKLVPDIEHNTFCKINTKEIKKMEQLGDLASGAYEEAKATDKENRRKLVEKAQEDADFIKKPLRKVLQVRQINASPETQLMICLAIILVSQIFLVKEIRRENQDLLDRLQGKINTNRTPQGEQILTPKVETVEI